jgi:two-component system sensor histidine kinase UhpB
VALYWRVFLLNSVVFVAGTSVLALSPATVSSPVLGTEALVLAFGLAVILVANAILLRVGLAPLDRLTRLMRNVDPLRPGQRVPMTGGGTIAELIRTFNEMLLRLEIERSASSGQALSAQEAERHRIAQELHDEIGQSLTAILLELKRAADRAPQDLKDDLLHTQETARQSLDEVRRIARRLRPGVLEDLGLSSALTALAADFSRHTGIPVRRRLAIPLPALSRDQELVLYRVTQECLTNVARHAGASVVHLELLHAEGTSVTLRIADDGKGLDNAPEGAGIRGMRERALLIGADLEMDTGASSGLEVRLKVPQTTQRS